MERADRLTNHDHRPTGSGPSEPQNKPSAKAMDRLWTVMLNIFGHQFESSFGTTPSAEWTTILAGITPQMMGAGIERMKNTPKFAEWPPNALAFRALCIPRGEDLGFPSLDEAFQQAVGNRTEKHPAVVHTLRHLDSYALRRMPGADAHRAFARAWQKTIDEIAAGGELPAAPIGLADDTVAKPKRERSPEEIQRCASMLAGILGELFGGAA